MMKSVIKYVVVCHLLLLGLAAIAAPSRTEAVAAMQNSVKELGAIMEKEGVMFHAETLADDVLAAVARAVDPGAIICTPEEARRLQDEEKGIFYGIGITVRQTGPQLKIVEMMTNGPAQKAGVPLNAVLERIDGQDVAKLTFEQALGLMRGQQNQPVTIAVRPPEKGAAVREFTLNRSMIQAPVTGTQELWPQQIGFLKINGLFEGSGEQVAEQLRLWSHESCSGIILDLRDANGNNINAVAEISRLFAHGEPELFVLKDGFDRTLQTFKTDNEQVLIHKPVMVLVNENTRGAAETLAAVLQNCNGVMLVGRATSGDNRFRAPLPLPDNADKVLYIAVQRVELRQGHVNKRGLQPDIPVAANVSPVITAPPEESGNLFAGLSDKEKNDRALNDRCAGDPILQRAADVLLSLKALNFFKP